jgi:3-oxoacyl-[acyl-carrier-protein] synthase II
VSRTRPIAITACGVVSPFGVGLEALWRGLVEARSAVAPLAEFEVAPAPLVAPVRDFDPHVWLPGKPLRGMSRSAHLACTAAALALDPERAAAAGDDAVEPVRDPQRVGLVAGTAYGNVHSMVRFDRESWQEGPRFVDATLFPNTVINSPAGFVSIFCGLTGSNTTVSDGVASSLAALDYAAGLVRRGQVDEVLAGGFEELSSWVVLGLRNAGRLTQGIDPEREPRPLDAGRTGLVPGEGAGFLRLAAASERPPLAWITGLGAAVAPGSLRTPHAVGPEGAHRAMTEAMQAALRAAELPPAAVDAVWTSASGSPALDALEAQALHDVFGPRAATLPLVAIKAAIGECFGASGALQVAAAVRALRAGLLPPTRGAAPASALEGLHGLSAEPRPITARHVLVNAFDGLGNNRSLVLSSPAPS